MHARMSRLQGIKDFDGGMATFRDEVIPKARELGATGFLAFGDRSTGDLVTFTLWESEDALKATESSADELRRNTAQQLGATNVVVERYEVGVVDVPAGVRA